MFGLGPAELLIIGVFALLFIGPKKLPELARGLGKSLREFQKAKSEFQSELDHEAEEVKNLNKPAAKSTTVASGENTNAHPSAAEADIDSEMDPTTKPEETKPS